MSERSVVFSRKIGPDLFETIRITFDGVREARGFRRAVTTTRHEYRVNGHRLAKDVWRAMLNVARERPAHT